MNELRLFHVSEDPNIRIFQPRARSSADGAGEALVWAMEEWHLSNYLVPRDCPRVCFWPVPTTTKSDRAQFFSLSAAERIIAVESGWLPRIADTTLYLYELPAEGFELEDANAGYWVTRERVTPTGVTKVTGLLQHLVEDGSVELRLTPSLWPLHDAVAASSLGFSMIRMRNAQPRSVLAVR